jgi:TRAP-type C4-dicarboxylate transport system substrate-binding protein
VIRRLTALPALVTLLLVAACARPVPTGVTELVYASPYSPNHTFSLADRTWIQFVERESGGTLRIRPVWSGGLLSADQSMIELRHGVADIGLITPIYAKGGSHLTRVQSGFYAGAGTPEAQVALYRCMASRVPQFAREMAGLRVLAVQGGTLPGIITRDRPIRTIEDLRGMRIRAPTEWLQMLKNLGADPVNMPMGDVYSSMAKGVIDGVVASAETFKALHFAEVAQYYTRLDMPRGAYPARAMGSARWNRLSPEHQQLLDRAASVWEAALAHETQDSLRQGLEIAARDGVVIQTMAPVQRARFLDLYQRDIESSAAELARYGIDGMAALKVARASIRPDNKIQCETKA